MEKTYAKIATTGTHIMHIPIRNIAKHLHHNGHSLAIVTPFSASHASYEDPDMIICTNDATSIPNIATGEMNFQHINQYRFGRDPVISSMSFENLQKHRILWIQLHKDIERPQQTTGFKISYSYLPSQPVAVSNGNTFTKGND